jgi:hypothetical protein
MLRFYTPFVTALVEWQPIMNKRGIISSIALESSEDAHCIGFLEAKKMALF